MSIVPLGIGGYISFINGREALEDQMEKQLTSVVTLKEEEIRFWLEEMVGETSMLAEHPPVVGNVLILLSQDEEDFDAEYTDQEAYEALNGELADHVSKGDFLELFIMRERDGRIMFSTDERSLGKFKSTKTYFKEGKRGSYLQSVYYSLTLQGPAMTSSAPIRDKANAVVGVLGARINLEKLNQIMEERTGMGRTGETYLVNKYNFFVSESKYEAGYPFKKGIYTEGVNMALSGKDGVALYNNYRDKPVIGAYALVESLEVALLAEVEQAEAFKPVYDLRDRMIVLGILFAIFAIILGFVLTKNVVLPIHRIIEGTEKIRRGNLGFRLDMGREDEIGTLSNAFDRMTGDLEKFTAELQEYSNELESKVRERTRELEESEARHRGLIETSLDAIISIDESGEIILWNKAAEKLFGYTVDEISGKPVTLLIPEEYTRKHVAGVKRYLETGIPKVIGGAYETEGLTKEGRRVSIELSLFEEKVGDKRFFTGILRDITERKRAEEALKESEDKFRTLAETAASAIFIYRDKFLYVNPAGEALSGYSSEELLQMPISEVVHPDFRDVVIQRAKARLEGKSVLSRYEFKIITKNGEERWVDFTGGVVYYKGAPAGIGTAFDITERKRFEDALKKYAEQLENTNRMMGLFTDILSHDLLNPAGLIRNAAELMREEEGGKEELGIIINNAQRLIEIITMASQLGKLESTERLDKQKLDLTPIIRSVSNECAAAARAKDQKLVFEIAGPCEAEVNQLIGQVFTNLLTNAMKYSPEKTTVTIGISDEGNSWRVYVKDQGEGVRDEDKRLLFNRFRRLSKKGVRGTGLGLSIAKRIVELHNGEIWVEDNPGGGSIFYVRLPKKQVLG